MSAIEDAIRSAFGSVRGSVEGVHFPLTARRAAFVAEVRAAEDSDRVITATVSTERKDRYGDVLRASGFDTRAFEANPTILWAHNSTLPPVGRALKVWKEANPPALAAKIEFTDEATNPFGAQIGKMYRAGYLKSFSVGFRPTEPPEPIIDEVTGRTTGYEFAAMELLEVSAVNVPANADARIRAVTDGILSVAEAASIFDRDSDEMFRTVQDMGAKIDAMHAMLQQILTLLKKKSMSAEDEFFEAFR